MRSKIAGWATLLTLLAPSVLPAQRPPCPPSTDSDVAAGFRAFRTDSLSAAESVWRRVISGCPTSVDARLGLGLLALRRNELAAADSILRNVVRDAPQYVDAILALGRSAERGGRPAEAQEMARRARRLAPSNAEVGRFWDRLFPDGDRPAPTARPRPDSLVLVSRTTGERFQVRTAAGWQDIYLQGVNLGVALPGRFPSEFPLDSLRYAGWLDTLALMGANTVRVYTILPPPFYRALRAHNLAHPASPIWLVHGVWTELPPHDDFDDAVWKGEFRAEMRRVVDLLHGTIAIPPRPGHAAGTYDADVSRWTLAYIIGREWEPFAVKAFDSAGGGRTVAFRGRFLEMASGPRSDAWMAEQSDYLVGYEFDRYHALRPVAYTNWPTLDPLKHSTEANNDEESVWRRRSGRLSRSNRLEYENDAIGLDAMLVRATPANPAGWFASYHAYPYYPDFMNLDPGYAAARSSFGRSNYFGYLRDLQRHHAGVPLLISEYGVPSSRGNAHRQPQGWDHGGHDEAAQAAIDARLTREIRESGAAGAIIFALIDEWFKKNWAVMDLEIPLDRTRHWHNRMDAEQNYGIWAMEPGDAATRPRLGGDLANWRRLTSIQTGPAGEVRVGADAGWLYISIELAGMAGRPFAWADERVRVALDTYRRGSGERRLPGGAMARDIGFEFVVEFAGPDSSRMLVMPSYDPYRAVPTPTEAGDDRAVFYHRLAASRPSVTGEWKRMEMVTNRARFGRDGTFYPAQGVERGALRFGTEDATTLADWWYDESSGMIQLRLPWGLLNVTDPSTHTVLHDSLGVGDFATTTTDGIAIGVLRTRDGDRRGVVAATPALEGSWRREQFRAWRWERWEEPVWHSRLKPVFGAMREVWGTP
jgi:hypothetical protein